MSGVNKAIVIGTLGQDPEMRYTSNGSAICNVSVATSESWKDKTSGEKKEKTEWHRITMFGKLAEIGGQYLKKGKQAYFEGRIETSKYQKEGKDHYSTQIIANQMQMLGGKGDNSPEAKKAAPTADSPVDIPNPGNPEEYFDDLPF